MDWLCELDIETILSLSLKSVIAFVFSQVPKKAERSITLEFVIIGRDHTDYNKRVKAFDALMDNGFVTIQVPKSKDDVYRLYCARKSSSYSRGKGGSIGKKSLKLVEYNPTNRGELTDSDREKFTLKEFEDIE